MECFRVENTRRYIFRGKKKIERRKESRNKRDKSDEKKVEIRLVLYVREGFSFRPF
jgi:hypothetical protein